MDPLKTFWRELPRAPRRLLLLDYDGTLAPFRVRRDHAFPDPRAKDALTRIVRAGHSHVSIVSGRPVAQVQNLLGLTPTPEIWGCHGWERQRQGEQPVVTPLASATAAALAAARDWLARSPLAARAEVKPVGLAVHWRGLPDDEAAAVAAAARAGWEPLLPGAQLELVPFAAGLELRPQGRDKGSVVRTLLREAGPAAAVAYIGDDRTDEDAFAALQGRGLGLLVAEADRSTAAAVRLCPPDGVAEFLECWARLEAGADTPAERAEPEGGDGR